MTAPAAPPPAPDVSGLVVSILGGTGDQGRGLARRFALAGTRVVLGSRDAARAQAAAAELPGEVSGADNAGAAAAGDVVIIAVPYDGHRDLLTALAGELAGKVVVDCVNPLGFDKQGAYALEVEEGSAAQQALAVLPDSRVVAAFHHVSAVLLLDEQVARSTPTCSCSATTARRPTSCRHSSGSSPACAASTPAACATPARWRP
jgi:NADPH-dependent F420 reductase